MWALTLPRMVARAWVEQCIDPDDAGLWILELCNTRKRARQPGRVVPRRPPRAGERKTGWICAEVAGPWPLAIAGLLGRARRNADALLNVLRDYAVGILSIYQFIRHLQSFGSGRHSRRSLMARRRPRVNQESFPRASLAG